MITHNLFFFFFYTITLLSSDFGQQSVTKKHSPTVHFLVLHSQVLTLQIILASALKMKTFSGRKSCYWSAFSNVSFSLVIVYLKTTDIFINLIQAEICLRFRRKSKICNWIRKNSGYKKPCLNYDQGLSFHILDES